MLKKKNNQSLMALLAPMFGGQIPQFAPGGDMDPQMSALLVGAGFLPKHRDTRGQYLLPGQKQGGQGGLDGQTFQGLDALHAMQQGRSDRYSSPTFTTPEMGLKARVPNAPPSQGRMSYMGQDAQSLLPPAKLGGPAAPQVAKAPLAPSPMPAVNPMMSQMQPQGAPMIKPQANPLSALLGSVGGKMQPQQLITLMGAMNQRGGQKGRSKLY